jgi:hypothetical protein
LYGIIKAEAKMNETAIDIHQVYTDYWGIKPQPQIKCITPDKPRLKIIYIAAPYRSDKGEWYVRQNIRIAEEAAVFVWSNGGVALTPHKNTSGFGGVNGLPDSVWLEGDLELLRRCDAVWMVDEWRSSRGARQERAIALEIGLPILYSKKDVLEFLGLRA